jgi:hypothetical protein
MKLQFPKDLTTFVYKGETAATDRTFTSPAIIDTDEIGVDAGQFLDAGFTEVMAAVKSFTSSSTEDKE